MEKRLLTTVSIVAKWAKYEVRLTDKKITAYYRLYPEVYEIAKTMTFDEIIEFIKKYENDETYGKNMKVLLSPEGREYVRYLVQLAQEWKPQFVKFSKIEK